jgi:ribonuclease HII
VAFAAAVILNPALPILGLADSKTLSALQRERLRIRIMQDALSWSVASASVEEIDSLNILHATMLAMRRACLGLSIPAQLALVDGNRAPSLPCTVQTIVKGDASEPAISAASILAKCARDADCMTLHAQYPIFGFDRHKGYPTALHLAAILAHGVTPAHRRSFGPVRRCLEQA